MFKKGELVCRRGLLNLQDMISSTMLVQESESTDEGYTYQLMNVFGAYMTMHAIDQHGEAGWYRLLHEGKTLAPLELQILACVYTYPMTTIEYLSMNASCSFRANRVRETSAAISRIAKKGFTTIHNFVQT